MKLIKLISNSGNIEMWFNPSTIICVHKSPTGNTLVTTSARIYEVAEKVEDVMKKYEEATT